MQPYTLLISAGSNIDSQLDNAFKCSGDQPLYPGKPSPFFEGAHGERVWRSGDSNHASHLTPTNGVRKQECEPGAHCTSSQRITNIFTNIRPHSTLARSQ